MSLALPEPIRAAVAPVFEALPLERAMPALVPSGKSPADAVEAVRAAVADPALAGHEGVKAGLWLYVDELDLSHDISQSLQTPTGSLWHAIMHRREGDFWNSKYWYRNAGNHPALSDLSGFDPYRFVDQVEQAHQRAQSDPTDLVAEQRQEWRALLEWCAGR